MIYVYFLTEKQELQKPSCYSSRFRKIGSQVISDRTYNVKSIAKASMGSRAVLDCTQPRDDANQLTLSLSPDAANGALYNVKMKVLSRQQQESVLPVDFPMKMSKVENGMNESTELNKKGLYTAETTRQDIRLDTSDPRVSSQVRDIETITVFDISGDNFDVIDSWQRTSSYLTRSSLQYVDAKGRPIDVRCYHVKYRRTS